MRQDAAELVELNVELFYTLVELNVDLFHQHGADAQPSVAAFPTIVARW